MKKMRAICVCLVICCTLNGLANAANDQTIQHMKDMVRHFEVLPVEKRSALQSAIDEVLSTAQQLGPDKTSIARENFRFYLLDKMPDRKDQSDEQFAVAVNIFKWSLANFATLPEIDNSQRLASQKLIDSILNGAKKFINDTYTDMPQPVKDKLFDAVKTKFSYYKDKIGNYFYPQYLYAKGNAVSEQEVVEVLSNNDYLSDNSQKYSPVAAIMKDERIAENSKLAHVDMLIDQETFKMIGGLERSLNELFTMTDALKQKKFKTFPDELREAEKRLHHELVAEATRKQENFAKERKHEQIVREFLNSGETMDKIVSGVFADEAIPKKSELNEKQKPESIETKNIVDKAIEAKVDDLQSGDKKPMQNHILIYIAISTLLLLMAGRFVGYRLGGRK